MYEEFFCFQGFILHSFVGNQNDESQWQTPQKSNSVKKARRVCLTEELNMKSCKGQLISHLHYWLFFSVRPNKSSFRSDVGVRVYFSVKDFHSFFFFLWRVHWTLQNKNKKQTNFCFASSESNHHKWVDKSD